MEDANMKPDFKAARERADKLLAQYAGAEGPLRNLAAAHFELIRLAEAVIDIRAPLWNSRERALRAALEESHE